MRQVWKFSIDVNALNALIENVRQIPKGAKLLHVREQGEAIAMWMEVDTDAPLENRLFQLFGTGHGPIPDGLEYVGTGIFYNGALVLHLYEVKE